MKRRAFTLIELLVVIVIIAIISAVALPTILPALAHRQVSEAARLVQGALVGARDSALHRNAPSGFRLLPDPAWPLQYLPSGQLDPTVPLAASRIVPLEPAPEYTEGAVSVYPGQSYAVLTPLPCLVIEESIGAWIQPAPGAPYVFLPGSPTSWFWNIRVGDKIQVAAAGRWYTVAGPMATGPSSGNSELFCNAGQPGQKSPLSRTLPSPDGQSVTVQPEFLFLVNGQDDNQNGWIDEGFDGVDNNNVNGIDEPAEWEIETWQGSLATAGALNAAYAIQRRPVPSASSRGIDLPTNVVIDLTPGRSRLPVDPRTGFVDILVYPNGSVVPTTIYSTPASVGLAGSFLHFWLAERSDVSVPPAAIPAGRSWLVSVFSRTGRVVSTEQPDPVNGLTYAQQGGAQ